MNAYGNFMQLKVQSALKCTEKVYDFAWQVGPSRLGKAMQALMWKAKYMLSFEIDFLNITDLQKNKVGKGGAIQFCFG